MWTTEYIFSQIFVVLGLSCLAITYLIKNRVAILCLCVAASVFYGLQYLLLGGYIAVALNVVGIIRGIWYYFSDKKSEKKSLLSLIVISCLVIVLSIVSFKNAVDLLAIIATLTFTYLLWQTNNSWYRWGSIFVSCCWIAFNIYYMSIFGIACECVLLVVEIMGVILLYRKYGTENKKKKE